MAKRVVEPSASGELAPERVPTGQSHTFVAKRLLLDHRYHDEDPVQQATFSVKFGNGLEVTGTLDAQGKATLIGVPGAGEVRYGPDQRAFGAVVGAPEHDRCPGDTEPIDGIEHATDVVVHFGHRDEPP